MPAGTAQVLYSLQPLWSALFGFVLLGESFTPQGAAGASVILAAVLLAAAQGEVEREAVPEATSSER